MQHRDGRVDLARVQPAERLVEQQHRAARWRARSRASAACGRTPAAAPRPRPLRSCEPDQLQRRLAAATSSGARPRRRSRPRRKRAARYAFSSTVSDVRHRRLLERAGQAQPAAVVDAWCRVIGLARRAAISPPLAAIVWPLIDVEQRGLAGAVRARDARAPRRRRRRTRRRRRRAGRRSSWRPRAPRGRRGWVCVGHSQPLGQLELAGGVGVGRDEHLLAVLDLERQVRHADRRVGGVVRVRDAGLAGRCRSCTPRRRRGTTVLRAAR